ncbi:hypothetical protein CBL_03465 [Carabus blaptoides fortunei]
MVQRNGYEAKINERDVNKTRVVCMNRVQLHTIVKPETGRCIDFTCTDRRDNIKLLVVALHYYQVHANDLLQIALIPCTTIIVHDVVVSDNTGPVTSRAPCTAPSAYDRRLRSLLDYCVCGDEVGVTEPLVLSSLWAGPFLYPVASSTFTTVAE